jgi:FMN phosphatase YigB (HAD superfamily)
MQAVIWDIDDVLIDTKSFQRKAQKIALEILGVSDTHITHYISLWDRLFWYFDQNDYLGIINTIFKENPSQIRFPEKIMEAVIEAANVWEGTIPLNDGVLGCLELLKEKRMLQGVVSNGRVEYQLLKLTQNGLIGEFFNREVVYVEPSRSAKAKPRPDMILECCGLFQVQPSNALYIGDRTTDIIAANLAGAVSVLINRHAPEKIEPQNPGILQIETPDHTFASIAKLHQWFQTFLS